MKPKVTWVLIADGSQAKVFQYDGPDAGLSAVRELMVEEEALRAQDIMADRPGRTFASVGGSRSGYEPPTDPVDVREARFMKTMAGRLDEKLRIGAFEQLVIAAAPAALGEIRPQLSKALRDAVIAELPKDLTNLPTPELENHLRPLLAPRASTLGDNEQA